MIATRMIVGSRAIVVVNGEIDSLTSSDLEDAINEAVSQGCRNLMFDIGDMRYIDSTGLRVLANAAKMLHERSGSISLLHVSSHVHRLLEISGLLPLFNVVPARRRDRDFIISFDPPTHWKPTGSEPLDIGDGLA